MAFSGSYDEDLVDEGVDDGVLDEEDDEDEESEEDDDDEEEDDEFDSDVLPEAAGLEPVAGVPPLLFPLRA